MAPRSLFVQAEALVALERLEEAVAEYGELIDARLGGVDGLLRRAELLQRLGRPREAEADMLTAAEVDPALPWACLRLAQLLHLEGRFHVAAAQVERALARQPGCAEALNVATAIYGDLQWLDRAAAAGRRLVATEGHWAEAKRVALATYAGFRADTLATLRRADRAAGGRSDLQALASALFRLGRLRTARTLCEALMRDDPRDFPPFALCARIVARREGPAGAASFLRALRFLHGDAEDFRSALVDMEAQARPLNAASLAPSP